MHYRFEKDYNVDRKDPNEIQPKDVNDMIMSGLTKISLYIKHLLKTIYY